MLKIDHPQIYIYSYQLSRKSPAKDSFIWTWVAHLWKYFSPQKDLDFPKENLTYPLSEAKNFSCFNKIEGLLRFCRLDDSTGIFVAIGSPETNENKDVEIQTIKEFNPNNLILAESYQEWLGQTILITYKAKTYQKLSKDNLRQVADECLVHLLPQVTQRPQFYRATELFGSSIFEYSSPQSQLQVLVYQVDDAIEKQLASVIQILFELFYHRHKMAKAFIDSREIYNLGHDFDVVVKDFIAELENSILQENQQSAQYLKESIKQLLHDSLNYERTFQALEDFENTINIHVDNYQQKLTEMSDRLQLPPEALTTFNLFIEKTAPYFQRQIQGDLGYFKHGKDLITTAIASIRGIVEIEQTEIDKNLQDQIQSVGVGITAGAIVASTSGLITQPWSISTNKLPHPFIIASFLSISCSLGAWYVAKTWIQHKRKSNENR